VPPTPRSVDTPHYHLWTDALHARELARETQNEWDRGSYVRWTIQAAWTAFESTCEAVLGSPGLGMRFRERFDDALDTYQSGLAVDWGQGIWQRVLEIYQLRKDYAHPLVPQHRLFAPLAESDKAIAVVRDAVTELHSMLQLPHPQWVDDDSDRGWQGSKGGAFVSANLTVIRKGARDDDPNRIRVVYVYQGEEKESEVLPADTDPRPIMEDLIQRVIVPISEVRAYRGDDELIDSIPVQMRGS
jgi:hypothetical protein